MYLTRLTYTLVFSLLLTGLFAQTGGTIRGNVYEKESGDPVLFGNIQLIGTDYGTNTDENGFFSISNLPPGDYQVKATYLGFDSTLVDVQLKAGQIVYERIFMEESGVQLATVELSARREKNRSDVQVSKVTVTPREITSMPSTGGEPDIAQYLPILPGVVVSGDQGGQLYIRGGAPVQNKILLDGMTIYNPFHSIGFFSVFETETIRSVDVYTGGFNAEYGGRVSAIVDINTREGNKKRLSGLVSASPFQAKALVEGPIKKLDEQGGGATTFMVTGKHSYLDQSSKLLYDYAIDTSFFAFANQDSNRIDLSDIGLPYNYTDLYGKVSFIGSSGSQFNLFGFTFDDNFTLPGVVDLGWNAFGAGTNFRLVPSTSNLVIDGTIAYTDYKILLDEGQSNPRQSGINSYTAALNFSYFGNKSELKYGLDFTGFNTDFEFENLVGLLFQQEDFTTEVAAYLKYKGTFGPLIIEPGLRLQYYASQSDFNLEPRIGLKLNVTDFLRFKAAGGLYSQNLISTVNDLDVVNFFVGFLAGPESQLLKPGGEEKADHRLQKAFHGIAGIEVDLTKKLELNVEGYYKGFTQLININRNKLTASDPNFVTETGDAYGIDFSFRYEARKANLWATYSLGFVNRDDGFQEYPTIFDRRHNVNFLATYQFGAYNQWEAGLRWNLGSGFPFTQTQGFSENVPFTDLLNTDVLTGNFDLNTLLSSEINGGRLPYYHRMDASLKRFFELSKHSKIEVVLSVTNVYDRANIFYVDRITNNRVNQLPILPSLGVKYVF